MGLDRYHRQTLLSQIGESGQQRIAQSSVLIIGCGALGSSIAEYLARGGVGTLRIADRDIVELTNLQRQVLYEEEDVNQGLPKAIAASNRLRRINSSIKIEPHVKDVTSDNIEKLAAGTDLILDGTDNVATRYLINDVSIKLNIPWIYGGCVGTEGRMMSILPGTSACLRCVFPKPPDPQELGTCDTVGVLGPVASMVGAAQAVAATKILTGHTEALADELVTFDPWTNAVRGMSLLGARRSDCAACGLRQFEFLNSHDDAMTARLCGRNAVQVRASASGISLTQTAQKLDKAGVVEATPYLVRCDLHEGQLRMTAFEDGRVIVQGTNDTGRARSLVAKYFGS